MYGDGLCRQVNCLVLVSPQVCSPCYQAELLMWLKLIHLTITFKISMLCLFNISVFMIFLKWSEGRFGYTVREANISWGKTKWSTSVLQLDHSTWVLEYSLSSVIKHSSLLSLGTDVLAHMMFQAAKNVNRRVLWMFSASRIFIVEW